MSHPTRVFPTGSQDHFDLKADDGAIVELTITKNPLTGAYEWSIVVVEAPP